MGTLKNSGYPEYISESEVQLYYLKEIEKELKRKGLNSFQKIEKLEMKTQYATNIKTDGIFILNNKDIMLCEFKKDNGFNKNKMNIIPAVIQCLYYTKKCISLGLPYPTVYFIGDLTAYTVLPFKKFENLLSENLDDINWSSAPHSAWEKSTNLKRKIEDILAPINLIQNIDKWPLDLSKSDLKSKITTCLNQNKNIKIKFNKENFKKGFEHFEKTIFKNPTSINFDTKLLLFMDIITSKFKANIDVNGIMTYKGVKIAIHKDSLLDFINLYSITYSKNEISEIINRITELYRGREKVDKSAYPKEKEIVDYAHTIMEKNLGKDWKDKYIVWDPRCYTGNLTREYKFKNLYLSNPFKDQLEFCNDLKDKSKNIFEFDFKDDEIKAKRDGGKLPNELYDALINNPENVIIFTDPEIGSTANGQRNNLNINNNRIMKDLSVKKEMASEKDINGKSSNELSNLYIFRSLKLNVGGIGIFSTTTFLRSFSNEKFKNKILSLYNFKDNFVPTNYLNFAIIFSLFINKGIDSDNISIKHLNFCNNLNNFELEKTKEFYTGQGPLLREKLKTKETDFTISKICLSTAINEKKVTNHKKAVNNYIGSLGTNSLIRTHGEDRCIFTAPYSDNPKSLIICKDNILECSMYYAIRSVIKPTIFNEADDFLLPNDFEFLLNAVKTDKIKNERERKFKVFLYNSLVFSIFSDKSYQSSLRKENGSSDIVRNEYFVLSLKETYEILNKINYKECIDDLKKYGKKNSFVYDLIEKNKDSLSPQAKNLLNLGRKVFKDSFLVRKSIADVIPEYQLNNYDAGYNQIKNAFKYINKIEVINEINTSLEKLGQEIYKDVFYFNFLKK